MQRLDSLGLPAGTAAAAPLNIPHGTAPTSPGNGDVWTTAAGIFVRVNGVTVGPLSAGASSFREQDYTIATAAISSAPVYLADVAQTVSLYNWPGSNSTVSYIVYLSDQSAGESGTIAVGQTISLSMPANSRVHMTGSSSDISRVKARRTA